MSIYIFTTEVGVKRSSEVNTGGVNILQVVWNLESLFEVIYLTSISDTDFFLIL